MFSVGLVCSITESLKHYGLSVESEAVFVVGSRGNPERKWLPRPNHFGPKLLAGFGLDTIRPDPGGAYERWVIVTEDQKRAE